MPKDRSFLYRVRQAYRPTPCRKATGEFVCDFPGELASYSAQELAALAHVSKATVTRFIQRLGYETYEEARRHARAEKQTAHGYSWPMRWIPPGAVRQRYVAQAIANLEATFLAITDSQIEAVTDCMMAATKSLGHGFQKQLSVRQLSAMAADARLKKIVAIPGPGQHW